MLWISVSRLHLKSRRLQTARHVLGPCSLGLVTRKSSYSTEAVRLFTARWFCKIMPRCANICQLCLWWCRHEMIEISGVWKYGSARSQHFYATFVALLEAMCWSFGLWRPEATWNHQSCGGEYRKDKNGRTTLRDIWRWESGHSGLC